MKKNSFTLVEIMIVVAIIGILAAIAIPNLTTSRNRSAAKSCIANMKQITGAIETYMGFNGGAYPASIAVMVTSGDLKAAPICPNAGATAYTLPVAGAAVVCPVVATNGTHVLP